MALAKVCDLHDRYSEADHPARAWPRVGVTIGGRETTMRKTIIAVAVLGTAAALSFGCYRTSHPSHKPDDQGNAAPLKDVASLAHAREIPQLEPYDGVDHLYRNAKSSLP